MSLESPMVVGRRADSARRRRRIIKALGDRRRQGWPRRQRLGDRPRGWRGCTFLYRHQNLPAQVHAAQAAPLPGEHRASAAVTRESSHADLVNAQGQIGRQAGQIRRLEKKLSELLDQQVFRESGLGAPDHVDEFRRRITSLEQENSTLRRKVADLEDDLDAARSANRDLMAQMNTGKARSG